jgi:hypothetical protein
MIQIAYTNSNCYDLWDVFQKQIKKHTTLPLYMITDKEVDNLNLSNQFFYKNNDSYYQVWIDALNKFNSEYFIYLQEDFFLYDDVNINKLNEYVDFLKNNLDYSFVRLIKSGDLGQTKLTDTLYEIESTNPFIFAMQATIWRTSDYNKLMKEVKDSKWFENDNYKHVMREIDMKGVYHYDGEPKRGINHYDTNVYPYVATALVKGKWNINEYPLELGGILLNGNIDKNIRGVY